MKHILILTLCWILVGCQFAGTAFTGARKITTILLDDRSFTDDFTDTKMNIKLRDAYVAIDPKLGLDIEPTIFEGKVLLTGALPNIDIIQQVIEATWKNTNTKQVYNYIRIAEPPSLDIVNQDAAISGAVRTQLTFTQGISSSNYKLTMENGTMYIMGIAKDQTELDTVFAVIKGTVGVDKIISLVRFKNQE
ncbi:MAG: BON domain-containing protein [Alphaproteobacteria bacterium]|nr:BON domain-containing protein [Alphaproteobacteria bacterium]